MSRSTEFHHRDQPFHGAPLSLHATAPRMRHIGMIYRLMRCVRRVCAPVLNTVLEPSPSAALGIHGALMQVYYTYRRVSCARRYYIWRRPQPRRAAARPPGPQLVRAGIFSLGLVACVPGRFRKLSWGLSAPKSSITRFNPRSHMPCMAHCALHELSLIHI